MLVGTGGYRRVLAGDVFGAHDVGSGGRGAGVGGGAGEEGGRGG